MTETDKSFLGTGWGFPPAFSRVDDAVVMVSDEQDIRESIWIIFSTSLGERIMLPEFGSQIWQMVFQKMTNSLQTQLRDIVQTAILDWEPRVDVEEITVQPESSVDGVMLISVDYTIRQTNTRSNLVYPFYFEEGTIPVQAP